MGKEFFNPIITRKDLEEPTLFRLNHILQLLVEQIGRVQGHGDDFTFASTMTFPSVKVESRINAAALSVHADNAAAISASVTVGDFYRTPTGSVMVVYTNTTTT